MFQKLTLTLAMALTLSSIGLGATPKRVEGGANQKSSVEGCINRWLFNGLIRMKVTKVTQATKPFSGDPGTAGYAVAAQIRNATHKDITCRRQQYQCQ